MQFNGVEVPSSGEKITLSGTKLVVPDNPIIPFIEGDGTGRDRPATRDRDRSRPS